MKKILLALAILAVAATSSFAQWSGVNIQWTTLWGVYTDDATDLTSLTDDFLLDSYSMTWQLIYSVNNTAGAPDLSNGANGWVSGDDTVWATRSIAVGAGPSLEPGDDTVWNTDCTYFSGNNYYENTGWLTAGYVYQRIYQDDPAVGSWFYDTTPVALIISPVAGTEQALFLDQAGGGTSGIQPDQQISAVPEPATMGLLGLGALVMAIRRRRS